MEIFLIIAGAAVPVAAAAVIMSLTEIPVGGSKKPAVRPRTIPGAEAFELVSGSSAAVLLVHGYTGSPYEMKELAEELAGSGFDAYCPLLPGHGTSENDLNGTRFRDWYDTVRTEYLGLRKNHVNVFVAGLSMGGTLALKLAEEFGGTPEEPSGLAVCSAPVQFNGRMDGKWYVKDLRLFLTGIIGRFMPLMPMPPDDEPADLVHTLGYKKNHSLRSLHSFKLGMKGVKRGLGKVKTPVCILHARRDREIGYENALFIHRAVGSAIRELHTIEFPESDPTHRHVLLKHILVRDEVFRIFVDFFRNRSGRPTGD